MAKSKKKTRQQDEFSDDEPRKTTIVNSDAEENNEPAVKAPKKKDKKKKAAKIEDDLSDNDIDPMKQVVDSEEDVPAVMVSKKKGKKDKKKKAAVDDSDDDVPVSKPKSAFAALADDDDLSEEEPKPATKGGFSALGLSDDDDDRNVVKPEDYPDSDNEKKSNKKTKEKKGKKAKKEEVVEEEDLDKLLADMNIEIKDDKKEKKKKKKDKKAEVADGEAAPTQDAKEAGDDQPVKADGEDAAEAAEDKKKKKKKKKKDEKEPAPDGEAGEDGDGETAEDKKKKAAAKGKKPGKAALAQMQEALRLMKEETERLEAEAEEKAKREEEAERLRIQKILEEKEKKELKKQREKERKERLKAEGKLLTKAQKQAQARAQATLEALRAQGIQIPVPTDKPADGKPKRANLITRKRDRVKQEAEDEAKRKEKEAEEPVSMEQDTSSVSGGMEKPDDSEEDVREAWDASSDSEVEAPPAPQEKVEPAKPAPASKAVVKPVAKPEESEEEDDDEDEESEEESDSEEDSSEEESSDEDKHEKLRHKVMDRIRKRKETNEKNKKADNLRSPVICVLGHVDTGKTKILDYIRKTHVQDNEAGGITQQIGATMVPLDAIKEQCKAVKDFAKKPLNIPGALIIDTPGHESFSNLRSRGSSLCDMAILVVDIMHGLEPQTIESINLLKSKKTPFVVALNKIDRLYQWKSNKHKDVVDVLESQDRNTKQEFEKNSTLVITQFAEQGLNAALFHQNTDPKSFISLVPTSAFSGDGMGNLISLVIELTQKMLAQRIAYSEELQATVLEVKALPGLGTTIDVIVVNGQLKEGDLMVLAGHEGPFTTPIRSLLMPQPLKELRVKNAYQEYKVIKGAQGVKIAAKDLDKAIAGLNVLIAHHPDEVEILKEEMAKSLKEVMSGFKLQDKGVYVQASTLGSLEALLVFLRDSKIPYSGIRIGPVVKKDVIKASVMLEHDSQFAVILAFDVKIERDAQEMADHVGVKIFAADIIYHLFDKFTAHREELRQKRREEFKHIAVFPCKLRILPQFVFKSRDPIIVGVMVEAGIVKLGTPICVPSQDNLVLGSVSSIEANHKPLESARKGEEICIRIENTTGDAPKLYGRHFDHTDILMSKISRESIDACKEHFRTDLNKQDWQLMVELKKTFQIL